MNGTGFETECELMHFVEEFQNNFANIYSGSSGVLSQCALHIDLGDVFVALSLVRLCLRASSDEESGTIQNHSTSPNV